MLKYMSTLDMKHKLIYGISANGFLILVNII